MRWPASAPPPAPPFPPCATLNPALASPPTRPSGKLILNPPCLASSKGIEHAPPVYSDRAVSSLRARPSRGAPCPRRPGGRGRRPLADRLRAPGAGASEPWQCFPVKMGLAIAPTTTDYEYVELPCSGDRRRCGHRNRLRFP